MIKFLLKFTGNTKKLLQVREVINDEFLVAMTSAQMLLETDVAANTPVNFGTLRTGIHGKVINAFHGIVGVEGAGTKYGDIIEMGRRPGKMPPEEPLLLWVRRKINPDPKELKSITYLVRRKIGKEGFLGKHMFQNAERKLKNTVIRMFEDAKNRVERLLSD